MGVALGRLGNVEGLSRGNCGELLELGDDLVTSAEPSGLAGSDDAGVEGEECVLFTSGLPEDGVGAAYVPEIVALAVEAEGADEVA